MKSTSSTHHIHTGAVLGNIKLQRNTSNNPTSLHTPSQSLEILPCSRERELCGNANAPSLFNLPIKPDHQTTQWFESCSLLSGGRKTFPNPTATDSFNLDSRHTDHSQLCEEHHHAIWVQKLLLPQASSGVCPHGATLSSPSLLRVAFNT